MKKIGSGWTYNVYEYDDYRVIKIEKSLLSKIFRILTADPRLILKIGKTIRTLDQLNKESFEFFQKLKKTSFDFRTLGNPMFTHELKYIQDKQIPVSTFLKENKEMEKVIDVYIEQIKYFWSYGFADMVFNFTLNNGLDNHQNITLFDFNEITIQKEQARSDIINQKWLKQHSFRFDLNQEQKAYFKKRMAQEITLENLENIWKQI